MKSLREVVRFCKESLDSNLRSGLNPVRDSLANGVSVMGLVHPCYPNGTNEKSKCSSLTCDRSSV